MAGRGVSILRSKPGERKDASQFTNERYYARWRVLLRGTTQVDVYGTTAPVREYSYDASGDHVFVHDLRRNHGESDPCNHQGTYCVSRVGDDTRLGGRNLLFSAA